MRVSVRNLVEFILREGDIDNRHGGPGVDQEAMLAGGRIHRKIQGGKEMCIRDSPVAAG